MPVNLSAEALDVLASGLQLVGTSATINRQLDRKLYTEVNAALVTLGGAWNRKAKAHVFTEDPRDALDQILVDGAFSDKKRDLNQFFTPAPLAAELVERADVRGFAVLEPSAGHGAIAFEAVKQGASFVLCLDKDPKCTSILFRKSDPRMRVRTVDFLDAKKEEFERIVMNPPFTRQQDIDHVLHAYSWLAEGGLLVAVTSAGVTFRTDRKASEFRKFVASRDGSIEKLPPKSFHASGTDVNAAIVTIAKRFPCR